MISEQSQWFLLIRMCGSSQKLADELGVHVTTLYRWIRGACKPTGSAAVLVRRLANEKGIAWPD